MKFPNCEVEVLPPYISDHSSLKVTMIFNNHAKNKIQPRFKFLNTIVEDEEFMDTIRNRWNREANGRQMMRLWRKLKRLQPIL